ncbi:MAG: hypothetical protein KAY10_08675 [Rhodoferax sp.]|nr:hypothetical protein [Rhodoferax sp.]
MSTLACSPALNWREVPLGQVTVLLPCKPDRAQRIVNLGPIQTSMQMAGCEAAGALYAVSHVRLTDPSQVAGAQSAWQKASLSNMRSETMHRRSIKRSQALAALQQRRTGPPSSDAMLDVLNVQGHNTDGTQVQAHLAWLADGSDLYHVAVYGVRLDSDTVDLLFSELKLQ